MRVEYLDNPGKGYLRLLTGAEVMHFVGWPYNGWKEMPSYETCVSLAGNAMSGYALGPVLNATMCIAGMKGQQSSSPPHVLVEDDRL